MELQMRLDEKAEEQEEAETAPKFRKKSVHTYKMAGQQPVKPDYTVMLKNGDGPASKAEKDNMKKQSREVEPSVPVSGNIFARCCQAIRHAIFGDLADQDIVRAVVNLTFCQQWKEASHPSFVGEILTNYLICFRILWLRRKIPRKSPPFSRFSKF